MKVIKTQDNILVFANMSVDCDIKKTSLADKITDTALEKECEFAKF